MEDDDCVKIVQEKIGARYIETVFFRVAIGAGYVGKRAEDKARELYNIYCRSGWYSLPHFVKDALTALAGKGA